MQLRITVDVAMAERPDPDQLRDKLPDVLSAVTGCHPENITVVTVMVGKVDETVKLSRERLRRSFEDKSEGDQ